MWLAAVDCIGSGGLPTVTHYTLEPGVDTVKILQWDTEASCSARRLDPGFDFGDDALQVALHYESAMLQKVVSSKRALTVVVNPKKEHPTISGLRHAIWQGDAEAMLSALPDKPLFDLVVSSPPYNIGKSYEKKEALDDYLKWQERILDLIIPRIKDTGSLCWQVGNFVDNGMIVPLDIEMAPIFKKHGLKLRNRIIWHFGHGLHNKRRFSGRYEVVMWYSKTDGYQFDVDPVRIRSKYPGKRHFKGPNKGKLSGNPLGKNPEDVWTIPNVKANHVEKTDHPCQFPVGLIERLVLSLTQPGQLVFDPFAGVGSAGVAAALHDRNFWGCELLPQYAKQAKRRIDDALEGTARYRPHDQELYDHTKSKLSQTVEEEPESSGE